MAQTYLQEHEDPIDKTQLLYIDISGFKELFFIYIEPPLPWNSTLGSFRWIAYAFPVSF